MGEYTNILFLKVLGSLSPKHKGSLKSFVKASWNIWEHCKYSTEFPCPACGGHLQPPHTITVGIRALPHRGWTTDLRHILPVSALRSLCGPGSTLAFGCHLVSLYPSPVCDSLPVYQLFLVFLDMLFLTSPGWLLCGIQNSECRKEA